MPRGRPKKDKTNEPKKMNIFDWLKEIMVGKRPWSSFSETDQNEFNSFMVNKFLSMDKDYIEIVNYTQFIPLQDKEKYYNVYKEMIPKKFTFSKYIKANKKEVNKDLLEKISKFYECSLGEAEEYIELLRKEGVIDILQKLGCDEKEIKKLVK